MDFIAHIKSINENHFNIQSLEDHLLGTSNLAATFAKEFNSEEIGRLLGLWHDLGKYSDEFQNYIRVNSGYEDDDQKQPKTDHTSSGAIHAVRTLQGLGYPMAYAIAGHHAGLLNWYDEVGFPGSLEARLAKVDLYDAIVKHLDDKLQQAADSSKISVRFTNPEELHLWIRMIFSCLVDADYLDTESFMDPETSQMRSCYLELHDLKALFEGYMQQLLQGAPDTVVNRMRAKILTDCKANGCLTPGFFSIMVPTGGGKTLSSMAWALEHAVRFGKRRIIFAIPYTSIITQTAEVYRKIFGAENVVEHHSNVGEQDNTSRGKLAIENWDAPIVVTTNVQLFESLHSNKPSHCRKLHNIANSIIILDEAQMLPPEFLQPILSSLKGLVARYGVSILLSTATQPTFEGRIGLRSAAFSGIEPAQIREIVEDVSSLAAALKRSRIELPKDMNSTTSASEIASELVKHNQVLCIVNTRKECKAIYQCMPPETLVLSRLMCTAHIMDVISTIKEKLIAGEPLRVVSTQLIEAGVDVDFPNVYRAFAGLDSIAQSAGRNNREGKMEGLGVTKIFCSENGVPPGLIRKGADAARAVVRVVDPDQLLTPETYSLYFREFYSRVNSFDKAKIKELLVDGAPCMKFQFAVAAKNFKLIDDGGTKSIVVRYGKGADLIEQLRHSGPGAWLNRQLQQFTVTVRDADFSELEKSGAVENVHGYWLQASGWLYSSHSGLIRNDEWMNEILIA